MKRISKKVREEAALICAIAASEGSFRMTGIAVDLGIYDRDSFEESPCPSLRLAQDARHVAIANDRGYLVDVDGDRILNAEAESLVRSGWSPGDEP